MLAFRIKRANQSPFKTQINSSSEVWYKVPFLPPPNLLDCLPIPKFSFKSGKAETWQGERLSKQ